MIGCLLSVEQFLIITKLTRCSGQRFQNRKNPKEQHSYQYCDEASSYSVSHWFQLAEPMLCLLISNRQRWLCWWRDLTQPRCLRFPYLNFCGNLWFFASKRTKFKTKSSPTFPQTHSFSRNTVSNSCSAEGSVYNDTQPLFENVEPGCSGSLNGCFKAGNTRWHQIWI